jgi:hypothetical protein
VRAVAFALFALVTVAGCRTQPLPFDDGGGGDIRDLSGVDLRVDLARPADLSRVDLARSCAPNCSRCQSGVCCGALCCREGEWCDPLSNTCRCGTGAEVCRVDQICATGGPIGPGQDQCGSICCGDPAHPCPL